MVSYCGGCERCHAKLTQLVHTDSRRLSLRAEYRRVWLMHVCLFFHTFAGIIRHCEVKEMIRELLEESRQFGDSDDDWCSCSGVSTASGYDSASEGWCGSQSGGSGADQDLEHCFALPC